MKHTCVFLLLISFMTALTHVKASEKSASIYYDCVAVIHGRQQTAQALRRRHNLKTRRLVRDRSIGNRVGHLKVYTIRIPPAVSFSVGGIVIVFSFRQKGWLPIDRSI